METAPTSSGDTKVVELGDAEPVRPGCVALETLDRFNLANVDFIKLDCEGYELHALKGGAETIKRCLPVIIVEQKPGRAQRFGLPEHGAVEWLEQKFSYRMVKEMAGDFILVPGGNV